MASAALALKPEPHPDETQNIEFVRGQTFMSPRPAPPHAYAASGLSFAIGPPFHYHRNGPGGWWILMEPEVHLRREVLIPDLAGWRRERMSELPKTAYFPLAPDWVCEVLSPGTLILDRSYKLPVYAEYGVSHVWLLDPLARLLEVYRLVGTNYKKVQIHTGDQVVRVEPFEAIELELPLIWPPVSSDTEDQKA